MTKKPRHKKAAIIVAIDFDGTLVEHDYPRIGKDIGAWKWVRALQELDVKVILYTMRSGTELDEACVLASEQEVVFWGVNNNRDQWRWTKSPKVYAHVYVDDAALGVPLIHPINGDRPYVDWEIAGPMLLDKLGLYDEACELFDFEELHFSEEQCIPL